MNPVNEYLLNGKTYELTEAKDNETACVVCCFGSDSRELTTDCIKMYNFCTSHSAIYFNMSNAYFREKTD